MVAFKGHQYIVQLGEIVKVDKIPLEVGDEFVFDKVLLVRNGDKVEFGKPYLNVRVTAEVLRNYKGKKLRIYKYRCKKHYRLTRGHRSLHTDIHITSIDGVSTPSKVDFAALAEGAREAVAV